MPSIDIWTVDQDRHDTVYRVDDVTDPEGMIDHLAAKAGEGARALIYTDWEPDAPATLIRCDRITRAEVVKPRDEENRIRSDRQLRYVDMCLDRIGHHPPTEEEKAILEAEAAEQSAVSPAQ